MARPLFPGGRENEQELMKMSAVLKVVADKPSPARAALAAAIERRGAAHAKLETAAAAVDRLQGLVRKESEAAARVASHEQAAASAAAQWARDPSKALELPAQG